MISDERLEEVVNGDVLFTDEQRELAKELLALRKAREGWQLVPVVLSAENGAKAALLGEFNVECNLECHECFGEGCDDCGGEGRWVKTMPVDWTTIKSIWAKGMEHFNSAAPEPE